MNRVARIFFLLVASVGVCSSSSFAQTRIEQNDPAIVYSGNWYTNDGATNTGGHAVLTNTRGARASITFNGTGISWIGVADAYAGLATVYLDGTMQVINTYNPISQYQKVLFRAGGLAPGAHTFSIEITHERGPGTDGSWVWIDAFDIEGTPIAGGVTAGTGRIEQNNPAMTYLGRRRLTRDPELHRHRCVVGDVPGSVVGCRARLRGRRAQDHDRQLRIAVAHGGRRLQHRRARARDAHDHDRGDRKPELELAGVVGVDRRV